MQRLRIAASQLRVAAEVFSGSSKTVYNGRPQGAPRRVSWPRNSWRSRCDSSVGPTCAMNRL